MAKVNNDSLVYSSKKIVTLQNLSPELLYFPVLSRDIKFFVDSKSDIFKEQKIYSCLGLNYYSNVSGKAIGTKKFDGKNYLVIKNDFREKYENAKSLRRKINKLSKNEIIDIINDKEGFAYSSNINYFINNFDSINNLVLSLLICEDSDRIYSEVFKLYNSEILEMFSALSDVFEIKNPVIILSDTDDENIEYVTNLSGMYPSIRVVLSHDKYPASHPLLISRKLNFDSALVLTPIDLYYLYSIIKRNKMPFEKHVLVCGENLESNFLVNTKFNVLVSDILQKCNINLKDDELICKNSAIRGNILSADDIVKADVHSLIIVKKDYSSKLECINCGLCNKCCPQKLNPQFYKLSSKPFPRKCIDCNMCSFVCPSKIGRSILK